MRPMIGASGRGRTSMIHEAFSHFPRTFREVGFCFNNDSEISVQQPSNTVAHRPAGTLFWRRLGRWILVDREYGVVSLR